mmetsp:Transcript_7277/g.27245  ORF Transcript_7277/g.27245 Transcript_7277/m.27245 type:complete len:137 (-) Transcript_7277:136-546(-)
MHLTGSVPLGPNTGSVLEPRPEWGIFAPNQFCSNHSRCFHGNCHFDVKAKWTLMQNAPHFLCTTDPRVERKKDCNTELSGLHKSTWAGSVNNNCSSRWHCANHSVPFSLHSEKLHTAALFFPHDISNVQNFLPRHI